MRKLIIALSTAAVVLSGAAIAQTAPANTRAPQTDMTRAQAETRAEARFSKMDANKDGTVNEADRAALKAQMFDRMDTDKSGSISRAELDAKHANRGDRGKAKTGEGKMGQGRHGGGMTHDGMQGGNRGHRGMLGKTDSPMTKQAFVARSLAIFDKADANNDGTVTVAEHKTARDAMRGQWKTKAAARQQG